MSIKQDSEKITDWIKEILPPVTVLEECRNLSQNHPQLFRNIMGYDQSSHPIEVYEFGEGDKTILVDGFPDPGEAIGGTTILAMLKDLVSDNSILKKLNLKWVFIPCLNFEDQPENGKKLTKVMKTKTQEVDWCLDKPREETKVLVNLAEKYQPVLSFPLHDEFHCDESVPPYFGVSPRIDKKLSENLRNMVKGYGLELDSSYNDSEMGAGFFEMSEIAEDYNNSTFSVLAKYGKVIICELSDFTGLSEQKLCEIQLSFILESINYYLNPVNDSLGA